MRKEHECYICHKKLDLYTRWHDDKPICNDCFIGLIYPQEIEKKNQTIAELKTRIKELEDKDWYEKTIKQLEDQNDRLINERDTFEKALELTCRCLRSPFIDSEEDLISTMECVKKMARKELKKVADKKRIEESKKNIFGERLKKLRTYKGLTQQELSNVLNVNRMTIVKWEKGSSEPTISTIKQIADCFETDVNYLVGEDVCKTKSQRIAELEEQLESMPKILADAIIKIIEPLDKLDFQDLEKIARVFESKIDQLRGEKNG